MELENIINIFNNKEYERAKKLENATLRDKVIIMNNALSTSFLVLANTEKRVILPIERKDHYDFWKELQSRPLFLSRMTDNIKRNNLNIEEIYKEVDPLSVAIRVIIENIHKIHDNLSAKLLLIGHKIDEVEIYHKRKEQVFDADKNASLITYHNEEITNIPLDEKIIF